MDSVDDQNRSMRQMEADGFKLRLHKNLQRRELLGKSIEHLNVACPLCKAKRGFPCTVPGTKARIKGWHAERTGRLQVKERNRVLDNTLKRLYKSSDEHVRQVMIYLLEVLKEDRFTTIEEVCTFLDKWFRQK